MPTFPPPSPTRIRERHPHHSYPPSSANSTPGDPFSSPSDPMTSGTSAKPIFTSTSSSTSISTSQPDPNPNPNPKPESNPSPLHHERKKQRTSIGISPTDILRLLLSALALNFLLSYYITGDSLWWNYPRPWFLHANRVRAWINGPLLLTPPELSHYNGTTPHLPILLALNATIYDVSAAPHYYGPGGMYSMLSGRDATRAFVTGCFQDDEQLVRDLGGVERVFLPVEGDADGEGNGEDGDWGYTEEEIEKAREMVERTVRGWVEFFEGSGKYFVVGRVVDESGEGEGEAEGMRGEEDKREEKKVLGLCEAAERARPRRGETVERGLRGERVS